MTPRCLLIVCLALLYFCVLEASTARKRTDHRRITHAASGKATCFDHTSANDIRLWTGRAPGATGDEPCRDIPFIRIYRTSKTNRQRSSTPVILIIPGGGYDSLSNTKEQTPVAEYFTKNFDVTTFVLFYRLVQRDGTYRYPVPMWDGQRAVKIIRSRASEFGIDAAKVGVFGFSAGGHLATMLTLHSDSDFGLPKTDNIDQRQNSRPDILGLGYPVISMDPASVPPSGSYKNLLRGYQGKELKKLQDFLSGEKQVKAGTPPIFLFESKDDAVISPLNSVLFYRAVKKAHLPIEYHLFAHGKHGAGLATSIPEENAWAGLFQKWLRGQKFIN